MTTNFLFHPSFLLLFLDPGSGMGKNQHAGSGLNIPDPQHCLLLFLCVSLHAHFYAYVSAYMHISMPMCKPTCAFLCLCVSLHVRFHACVSACMSIVSVADPDPGSGIGFFRIPNPKPIFFRA